MTAKEAREVSEKARLTQSLQHVESIKVAIQNEAEKGKNYFLYRGYLQPSDIYILQDLGFKVIQFVGTVKITWYA